jgi:predicted ATP-grasp superfamily ATP-dependent carboligase
VRDAARLASLLRGRGLPALDHRFADDAPQPDGRWMLKPKRGGSGRGVRVWDAGARDSTTLREPHYFQERREGLPISALYVGFPQGAQLVGVAQQIVGEACANAAPFRYCGSIAPIDVPDALREQIDQTGRAVAENGRLRGLFGVDYLFDGKAAWPVEVNPRYTASVELFERAHAVALLSWHWRACELLGAGKRAREAEGAFAAGLQAVLCTPGRVVGKMIFYAPRDLVTGPLRGLANAWESEGWPGIADRPAPGTRIAAGHPVCTVFAEGADPAECLRGLRARIHEAASRIADSSS